MKTISKIGLLVVVLLVLVACQPVPAPVATPLPVPTAAPAAGFDLADTSWILSSLNGALPLPGITVTLEFGGGGLRSAPMAATASGPRTSRTART